VSTQERQAFVKLLLHMKTKLTMETSGEELVVGGE
jgi:hypothetical protein